MLAWCSDGKESACGAGDLGLISGLGGSPGGRHGNPLQYSCLENPQGQRSLANYSPWGRKESDTTERLSTAQHIAMINVTVIRQVLFLHPASAILSHELSQRSISSVPAPDRHSTPQGRAWLSLTLALLF